MSEEMRIAIVDDEVLCLELLEDYLIKYKKENKVSIKFDSFDNGYDFLETYAKKEDEMYDAVFLDIDMPSLNGLETAKKIREIDKGISIVFVTMLAKLAIKGYEVDAINFLVKPISYFDFATTLKKIFNKKSVLDTIYIKGKNSSFNLSFSDIYMFESRGHFVKIYTKDSIITTRGSLNQIYGNINEELFVRTGVSFIVNISHIKSINQNIIKLGNNLQAIISRSKKTEVMTKLNNYLGEMR